MKSQFRKLIVKCYVKYWIASQKTHKNPLHDIRILSTINTNVSDVAIFKIIYHSYYYNEKTVVFSLFDERVNNETIITKKIVDSSKTRKRN